MEQREIVIDTLRSLHTDLKTQKFILRGLIQRRAMLKTKEEEVRRKIDEVNKRITYNIRKHRQILK